MKRTLTVLAISLTPALLWTLVLVSNDFGVRTCKTCSEDCCPKTKNCSCLSKDVCNCVEDPTK